MALRCCDKLSQNLGVKAPACRIAGYRCIPQHRGKPYAIVAKADAAPEAAAPTPAPAGFWPTVRSAGTSIARFCSGSGLIPGVLRAMGIMAMIVMFLSFSMTMWSTLVSRNTSS